MKATKDQLQTINTNDSILTISNTPQESNITSPHALPKLKSPNEEGLQHLHTLNPSSSNRSKYSSSCTPLKHKFRHSSTISSQVRSKHGSKGISNVTQKAVELK